MKSAPRRGDIYWVDFSPGRGSEQAGNRPALVVQNDLGNATSGCTVVAAISSAPLLKRYPFTVALDVGDGGLPKAGHVNCAQLLTVDQVRLGERIGSLSAEKMAEVNEALRYELGIP